MPRIGHYPRPPRPQEHASRLSARPAGGPWKVRTSPSVPMDRERDDRLPPLRPTWSVRRWTSSGAGGAPTGPAIRRASAHRIPLGGLRPSLRRTTVRGDPRLLGKRLNCRRFFAVVPGPDNQRTPYERGRSGSGATSNLEARNHQELSVPEIGSARVSPTLPSRLSEDRRLAAKGRLPA